MVARSVGSGTTTVSSRRCSVVSPALFKISNLSVVSFWRKNAIWVSFMYSSSGMAITSASVNSARGFNFQLLASLGSFLMAEASGGTMSGAVVVCMKLALAAVDATDWAIEGTVN